MFAGSERRRRVGDYPGHNRVEVFHGFWRAISRNLNSIFMAPLSLFDSIGSSARSRKALANDNRRAPHCNIQEPYFLDMGNAEAETLEQHL